MILSDFSYPCLALLRVLCGNQNKKTMLFCLTRQFFSENINEMDKFYGDFKIC